VHPLPGPLSIVLFVECSLLAQNGDPEDEACLPDSSAHSATCQLIKMRSPQDWALNPAEATQTMPLPCTSVDRVQCLSTLGIQSHIGKSSAIHEFACCLFLMRTVHRSRMSTRPNSSSLILLTFAGNRKTLLVTVFRGPESQVVTQQLHDQG